MKFQIESVESGWESDDITINGTFTHKYFPVSFTVAGETANEILKNSYNVFAIIELLRKYYSNTSYWKPAIFDGLEEYAKEHLQEIVNDVSAEINKVEIELLHLQRKKDRLKNYLEEIKESLS